MGPAVERLSKAPIRRLISSDSVLHRTDLPFQHQVVSLAPLLADAIRHVTGNGR